MRTVQRIDLSISMNDSTLPVESVSKLQSVRENDFKTWDFDDVVSVIYYIYIYSI